MNDQTSLFNLLRLMSLLGSPIRRTRKEYAELLMVHKSTITRYLRTLEEVGFQIAETDHGQPYIPKAQGTNPAIMFTQEQATKLSDLIQLSDLPDKQDLLTRIYLQSEQSAHIYNTQQAQLAVIYRKLSQAIKEEKQVLLKSYTSLSSSLTEDHIIEPIGFLYQMKVLEAFDHGHRDTRHFRLDRMGDVVVKNKKSRFKHAYRKKLTDVFGIADIEQVACSLMLTDAAAQALRETFPATDSFLRFSKPNSWILDIQVNKEFRQLDRFLLAWCDSISIKKPKELHEHLENKWNKNIIKNKELHHTQQQGHRFIAS